MMKTTYKAKAQRTDELLAQHLRAMRKELNLSMEELAAKLGTSQSVVAKIEQNKRRIDICEFVYYCERLGKNPAQELKIIAAY